VVARDVPALEAAIDDVRVAGLLREHAGQALAQAGRAARAAGRAEVELGQRALEEPGQARLDAVPVEQHRMAVRGANAVELLSQRIVIRAPVAIATLRDL